MSSHGGTVRELQDRCAAFLADHRLGVLILPHDGWAMPVRLRSRGLVIGCLLPRWAEIEFRLESHADVLLIVPGVDGDAQAWLDCRGPARLATSGWTELRPVVSGPPPSSELYRVIEIRPVRLDLVDQRIGWGWRENLDL